MGDRQIEAVCQYCHVIYKFRSRGKKTDDGRRFCSMLCSRAALGARWSVNLREQRQKAIPNGKASTNQKLTDDEIRTIWDSYVEAKGAIPLRDLFSPHGFSVPPVLILKRLVGPTTYRDTVRKFARMGSRYKRGRQGERRVRLRLEEAGYFVMRSAGSKGVWDLIAFARGKPTLLVQVKVGRKAGPTERQVMLDFPEPDGWLKEEWVLHRGQPPQIEVL